MKSKTLAAAKKRISEIELEMERLDRETDNAVKPQFDKIMVKMNKLIGERSNLAHFVELFEARGFTSEDT